MSRLLPVALVLLLALALSACDQPSPTPTPDLPATITAQVQAEAAKQPTPDIPTTVVTVVQKELEKQPAPTAIPTPALTPDIPATVATQVQAEMVKYPTPTAVPTPERLELIEQIQPPEHLAYIWWSWEDAEDDEASGFRELVIDFTIHNDVELRDTHGLYLILGFSSVSNHDFYFGLQTDVHAPEAPLTGAKGSSSPDGAPGSWPMPGSTKPMAGPSPRDTRVTLSESGAHTIGARGTIESGLLRTDWMRTASGSGCGSPTWTLITLPG